MARDEQVALIGFPKRALDCKGAAIKAAERAGGAS